MSKDLIRTPLLQFYTKNGRKVNNSRVSCLSNKFYNVKQNNALITCVPKV